MKLNSLLLHKKNILVTQAVAMKGKAFFFCYSIFFAYIKIVFFQVKVIRRE